MSTEVTKEEGTMTVPLFTNTSKAAKILGVSKAYVSALKKAADIGGARVFRFQILVDYLDNNPDFRVSSVYPRKSESDGEKLS
tara:strand:+ start:590 stop:838 length:249 start_codon:yes stop_codon:yes gene_type:complete